MDPQLLVIILRMVERILGVLIGGLLVYFAYRLFLSLDSKRGRESGTGEFAFRGAKIKLAKVGPGVFFAIFGAGLIAFSIAKPVALTTTTPVMTSSAGKAKVATATTKFIGATSIPENESERAQRRAEIEPHIAALNKTLDRASASERDALAAAVARAKLALMEPLWGDDWGELADFVIGCKRADLRRAAAKPQ